jgi:uncharacterized protein (TIRG00374 family)
MALLGDIGFFNLLIYVRNWPVFDMETRGLVNLPQGGRTSSPALDPLEQPEVEPRKPGSNLFRLRWWTVLLWLMVAGLLFLALRQVPLAQVSAVLKHLTLPQIGLLVLVNLVIVLLMTTRWWLVLRALGERVSLYHLIAYRLVGFGVSYFTPGPQFGGEPVQVHLLHRNRGLPLASAVTSVFLDRVIDLLVNFTFLVMGVMVVVLSGLVGGWLGLGMWLVVVTLLAFPLVHLLALARGRRPAAALLHWLWKRLAWKGLQRAGRLVFQAEEQVSGFLREKPAAFAGIIALSVVTWTLSIFEFWLCLTFLGVTASLQETVSAMTAARLSILMPLPGGLGALEAGQALATRLLGWGPAVGIALSLVIRARDVALALLGLWFGSYVYRSFLWKNIWLKQKLGGVPGQTK